jgi:hypothetical protein
LQGPGGTISLGAGAANAEEGISVEFLEDKDRMVVGADGQAMHSLIASKAGKVLVRLLKTSPVNGQLTNMYNLQTSTGLLHAQNTLVVTNPTTGDSYVCKGVAFTKFPRNDYAKEGGMLEWDFNASQIDPVLGTGILQPILQALTGL